jgi:hypothetical protein
MAFPTCCNLLVPVTLSADSTNLCVLSNIEPCLNSNPVDSVSELNSNLTALNSASSGCTGSPPGATLNPKLSLYFGDTQVNCPVIPTYQQELHLMVS